MARPSKEFLLAWSSLTSDGPTPGWQTIALPLAGPIEIRAGRGYPDNTEAVLLCFPSAQLRSAEKLPEGQGFSVERVVSDGVDGLILALTRRTTGGTDLFAAMTCDVVGAIDEAALAGAQEQKLLQVFLGRVGAWQEFMRKGSQSLSPEGEIGLVGELLLLRTIIDEGVPLVSAIESWVGPLDGIRDFEVGTGALEVKTTLSTTGFLAKIGSLEQLNDSARQPLFLVGTRLRQVESGQGLPELVAEIRDIAAGEAESVRLLSERLIAAGYFDIHADRYNRQFTLAQSCAMEINNDFPRLTPGNVHPGVTLASYEIDLDKTIQTGISIMDALKKLKAI